MRTEFGVTLKLSENVLGAGELGDHAWKETDDTHLHGDSRRFRVAASQTDQEIDLTDIVTVGALLCLRATEDVSVKFNSAVNTAISLKKIASSRYAYLVASADVTKLFVTTGASAVDLVVGVVGDT